MVFFDNGESILSASTLVWYYDDRYEGGRQSGVGFGWVLVSVGEGR